MTRVGIYTCALEYSSAIASSHVSFRRICNVPIVGENASESFMIISKVL